jgi:hypothetical protein
MAKFDSSFDHPIKIDQVPKESMKALLASGSMLDTGVRASVPRGHSKDRISYPLATSVTSMTILLTLQAMHSGSAFTARFL